MAIDELPGPALIDPRALLRSVRHDGPVWSLNSEQLNLNLLRFGNGAGVASHVNTEVDVFGVVVEGEGVLTLNDTEYVVRTGQAFLIPRGVRRAIKGTSATFAYLSCHRQRGGLMPS